MRGRMSLCEAISAPKAALTDQAAASICHKFRSTVAGFWYQGYQREQDQLQRNAATALEECEDHLRAEIPKVQRAIPAGVKLTIVSDRTVTIRASVNDVQFTLILSVVLVTLVVLLFLRSMRALARRAGQPKPKPAAPPKALSLRAIK